MWVQLNGASPFKSTCSTVLHGFYSHRNRPNEAMIIQYENKSNNSCCKSYSNLIEFVKPSNMTGHTPTSVIKYLRQRIRLNMKNIYTNKYHHLEKSVLRYIHLGRPAKVLGISNLHYRSSQWNSSLWAETWNYPLWIS